MSEDSIADQPAYRLLADLGKRTLRPGGAELTAALLEALAVSAADDVVEFAPGRGQTARRTLEAGPNSYTGVELDPDAAAALREALEGPSGVDPEIAVGNAAETDLPRGSADVVYGEAMLTMQPDVGKRAIVEEARRLLRPGGRYGVHELALADDVDDETAAAIRREAADLSNVFPQPLSASEWVRLLEGEGFSVTWQATAPMALLEPRRVVADEGPLRTLKIGFNLLTNPRARSRVQSLRHLFDRYDDEVQAIALVAERD
ncbi:class I SAM-dependent methyltransferase [Halopiger goleimassiliensis]|uniref:class I SAM-dependent methyltransferase n=1 Tax=Halopiger goleimassiliensis TaxID=1293048 RepID=UPI00067785A9|nr:class I SAM-dependent methyltransferase [Halopiger goleimassiliensis]